MPSLKKFTFAFSSADELLVIFIGLFAVPYVTTVSS